MVLNSERETVVERSVGELEFQAAIAELVGADTIVLHGGSAAGGMPAALARLERAVDRLSDRARSRLALENDDRLFAPADLLPLCGVPGRRWLRRAPPPLHGDGLSVPEATALAAATWGRREPWPHLLAARGLGLDRTRGRTPTTSIPTISRRVARRRLTVDVEAKAKERAVLAIME